MDILGFAVAVFLGNVLTVVFIWAFKEFDRQEKDGNTKFLTYCGVLGPLLIALSYLIQLV